VIEPKVVKGFRDILPLQEQKRQDFIAILQKVFRSYGYQPIDTPTLEYSETLLNKNGGETEKQLFRFTDSGGRDVAMRFDLTVPFARFLAMHKDEVGLPFKRSHIAKSWRGENPQRGRYREFYQCDFDVVGSTALTSDLDVLLLAHTALLQLGVKRFVIHINHRGLLNDFLQQHQLQAHSLEILHIIDKLDKIGIEAVQQELASITTVEHVQAILTLIHKEPSVEQTLSKLQTLVGEDNGGYQRLVQLWQVIQQLGLTTYFTINTAITRGLDYYTGIVFETFLQDLPDIGSVCSGGRYDNLVGLYSQQALPGVGGSIGLDRLLAAMEALDEQSSVATVPVVIIYHSDAVALYQMQQALLQHGIGCSIFPEDKKLDQQYKYAERLLAKWAIFYKDGHYVVRNLAQRENSVALSFIDAVQFVKEQQHGTA
jgi:histidyl-tRNA synthetase